MNTTITNPATGYRLPRAKLRRRWQQLTHDPLVAALPFKVELNEKGAIEVSPPTNRRALLQSFVANELGKQQPQGATFTGCPVETEIGMRVPDVVWASPEFMEQHRPGGEFRVAPDLCVEVLSPTSTSAEMRDKVAAYLAAGAHEVWLVGDDGAPEIYTAAGRVSRSALGFALPRPPAALNASESG